MGPCAIGHADAEAIESHPWSRIDLYALRFEPLYQYPLCGGPRLSKRLPVPLFGNDPVGEARLLGGLREGG